jgi:hypothetical protein
MEVLTFKFPGNVRPSQVATDLGLKFNGDDLMHQGQCLGHLIPFDKIKVTAAVVPPDLWPRFNRLSYLRLHRNGNS